MKRKRRKSPTAKRLSSSERATDGGLRLSDRRPSVPPPRSGFFRCTAELPEGYKAPVHRQRRRVVQWGYGPLKWSHDAQLYASHRSRRHFFKADADWCEIGKRYYSSIDAAPSQACSSCGHLIGDLGGCGCGCGCGCDCGDAGAGASGAGESGDACSGPGGCAMGGGNCGSCGGCQGCGAGACGGPGAGGDQGAGNAAGGSNACDVGGLGGYGGCQGACISGGMSCAGAGAMADISSGAISGGGYGGCTACACSCSPGSDFGGGISGVAGGAPSGGAPSGMAGLAGSPTGPDMSGAMAGLGMGGLGAIDLGGAFASASPADMAAASMGATSSFGQSPTEDASMPAGASLTAGQSVGTNFDISGPLAAGGVNVDQGAPGLGVGAGLNEDPASAAATQGALSGTISGPENPSGPAPGTADLGPSTPGVGGEPAGGPSDIGGNIGGGPTTDVGGEPAGGPSDIGGSIGAGPAASDAAISGAPDEPGSEPSGGPSDIGGGRGGGPQGGPPSGAAAGLGPGNAAGLGLSEAGPGAQAGPSDVGTEPSGGPSDIGGQIGAGPATADIGGELAGGTMGIVGGNPDVAGAEPGGGPSDIGGFIGQGPAGGPPGGSVDLGVDMENPSGPAESFGPTTPSDKGFSPGVEENQDPGISPAGPPTGPDIPAGLGLGSLLGISPAAAQGVVTGTFEPGMGTSVVGQTVPSGAPSPGALVGQDFSALNAALSETLDPGTVAGALAPAATSGTFEASPFAGPSTAAQVAGGKSDEAQVAGQATPAETVAADFNALTSGTPGVGQPVGPASPAAGPEYAGFAGLGGGINVGASTAFGGPSPGAPGLSAVTDFGQAQPSSTQDQSTPAAETSPAAETMPATEETQTSNVMSQSDKEQVATEQTPSQTIAQEFSQLPAAPSQPASTYAPANTMAGTYTGQTVGLEQTPVENLGQGYALPAGIPGLLSPETVAPATSFEQAPFVGPAAPNTGFQATPVETTTPAAQSAPSQEPVDFSVTDPGQFAPTAQSTSQLAVSPPATPDTPALPAGVFGGPGVFGGQSTFGPMGSWVGPAAPNTGFVATPAAPSLGQGYALPAGIPGLLSPETVAPATSFEQTPFVGPAAPNTGFVATPATPTASVPSPTAAPATFDQTFSNFGPAIDPDTGEPVENASVSSTTSPEYVQAALDAAAATNPEAAPFGGAAPPGGGTPGPGLGPVGGEAAPLGGAAPPGPGGVAAPGGAVAPGGAAAPGGTAPGGAAAPAGGGIGTGPGGTAASPADIGTMASSVISTGNPEDIQSLGNNVTEMARQNPEAAARMVIDNPAIAMALRQSFTPQQLMSMFGNIGWGQNDPGGGGAAQPPPMMPMMPMMPQMGMGLAAGAQQQTGMGLAG